ncbi:catechol 2,3-dioxygenase-like lactoylglutathione lyase family enzyme [Polaromonas sp. CG_9.5]|uniref:VOC family protein n=1 Tax=Polaromonas sp. CG_9.5 TaxID=3071705 RepID=UPI002E0777E9|nr:catechol 2,3-dioxygenase-like lactoylglutathione lyase family enzyme [Polaromonas sp. CG_9.5]
MNSADEAPLEEMPTTGGRVLAFAGFRRSVADLARAIDFYVEALGFACESLICTDGGAPRCARLRLGEESIELCEWAGAEALDVVRQDTSVASAGFQHVAIVASDMDAALSRLSRLAPTPISSGDAVRLPASAGGVTAYKFRDPDGHPLELISFPAGTGNPKWQRVQSNQPTLGIDHSAISVGNVERTLAFYTAGLGFALTSRQVNSGVGQDRLDGVSGVVVDVLGLTPAGVETPHLELLGYRQPAPQPRTRHVAIEKDPSDRLVWRAQDVDAIVARLASMPRLDAGGGPAFMQLGAGEWLLRDPDGHLMVLREAAA